MIYATGDLHGNTLRFQPQYFPEQSDMTKDDYMIVCGDAGLVWHGDKSDDPQLDRLEALPFTVLFLDGNHENFDALNEYPVEEWHGGKVHAVTIRGAAAERPHSTAIAPTSHGAKRSRATLCSILTIPMSVSSAVRTRTATC